jgi:hypothetical protein
MNGLPSPCYVQLACFIILRKPSTLLRSRTIMSATQQGYITQALSIKYIKIAILERFLDDRVDQFGVNWKRAVRSLEMFI